MPRKKKPDEHLYVDGEFDAPSVLNLVNISGKPKPQTYGQYLWGLMFGSEKEAFIHELAEMDPESAEAILENQEYPNQAKEMYIERMSDDNSHDEGGYTEEPDEDDDRAEYDEYNIYGDKEADGHGTTVNPEVAIAYTNDWLSATKGWGDSDDDGDEASEPDDNRDNIYCHEHNDTHEVGDDDKEIERDESDAYRETEYSPDEDFEQNFDEAAWGEAEGDVDADTDIDSADSDSDTGSDADSDADSGTEYGIDSDFGGSDTSWDMGDWGSWGDFDIDYGDYS